jgi:two-component system, NarL family, nitrate/nitrite response regulator NarL
MEDVPKYCMATNVDPRVGEQRHTINATDLSLASVQASRDQNAVTDLQTFATVLIGQSRLFREGLGRLLSARGFQVVGSAPRVDELGQSSVRDDRPVLLILDAGDDMETAIEQLEFIKQRRPSARIAVLADGDQIQTLDLVSLFRAGARAYFARETSPDAFLKSLELVMLEGVMHLA